MRAWPIISARTRTTGVDVQGRLIEVLTGKSFAEALAEILFEPLGASLHHSLLAYSCTFLLLLLLLLLRLLVLGPA